MRMRPVDGPARRIIMAIARIRPIGVVVVIAGGIAAIAGVVGIAGIVAIPVGRVAVAIGGVRRITVSVTIAIAVIRIAIAVVAIIRSRGGQPTLCRRRPRLLAQALLHPIPNRRANHPNRRASHPRRLRPEQSVTERLPPSTRRLELRCVISWIPSYKFTGVGRRRMNELPFVPSSFSATCCLITCRNQCRGVG